jgi:hypothetical protein
MPSHGHAATYLQRNSSRAHRFRIRVTAADYFRNHYEICRAAYRFVGDRSKAIPHSVRLYR